MFCAIVILPWYADLFFFKEKRNTHTHGESEKERMEESIKERKKQTKNANLVTMKAKTVKLHTDLLSINCWGDADRISIQREMLKFGAKRQILNLSDVIYIVPAMHNCKIEYQKIQGFKELTPTTRKPNPKHLKKIIK